MGISHASYCLRTDIASELQPLVLERIGEYMQSREGSNPFLFTCAKKTLKKCTSSESFEHMVRDDHNHIELVGVIYIYIQGGQDHGVRQLQFYKGS